jgi:hypothetical protein
VGAAVVAPVDPAGGGVTVLKSPASTARLHCASPLLVLSAGQLKILLFAEHARTGSPREKSVEARSRNAPFQHEFDDNDLAFEPVLCESGQRNIGKLKRQINAR